MEVREGVSRGGPDCCHNCASTSTPTTTMCARWVEVREGGSKGGGLEGWPGLLPQLCVYLDSDDYNVCEVGGSKRGGLEGWK